MFYIPNALLTAFVFDLLLKRYVCYQVKFVWIFLFVLLFPMALLPVLKGFIDIAAMLPLTLAYLLVIDRSARKIDVKKDFLLGICILWILLLRRYFGYAIIGGVVFALVYWTSKELHYENWKQDIKRIALDVLVTMIIPTVLLLTVLRDFLMRSLFNNHSYAYSVYQLTNQVGNWLFAVGCMGILFVSLIIFAFVCHRKNRMLLRFIISVLAGMFAANTMFYRVQSMGVQHYYVMCFPVCCLAFLGLVGIWQNKSKAGKVIRNVIMGFLIAKYIMFFGGQYEITKFVLSHSDIPNITVDMAGAMVLYPRQRNDMDALQELERYLGKLDEQGYQKVYCIASSEVLNDDILRKLNAPNYDIPYDISNTSHVDLRDGINTEFFDAEVILACTPVQSPSSAGHDLLLRLNDVFLTDNCFSDNYKVVNTFVLDNNVEVLVYTKKLDLDKEDIEYIRDIYAQIYPEYPELFEKRIDEYLTTHFQE